MSSTINFRTFTRTTMNRDDVDETERLDADAATTDPWRVALQEGLDAELAFTSAIVGPDTTYLTFRQTSGDAAVCVSSLWTDDNPIPVLATCRACGNEVRTEVDALAHESLEAAAAAADRSINGIVSTLLSRVRGCRH